MNAHCFYIWNIIREFYFSETSSLYCSAELQSFVQETDVTIPVYLKYFLITCCVEAMIYLPVGRSRDKGTQFLIQQILILNLVTHPFIFFALPKVFHSQGSSILVYVACAETFAFVIEALILRIKYNYPWLLATSTALIANVLSWTFGLWAQGNGWI